MPLALLLLLAPLLLIACSVTPPVVEKQATAMIKTDFSTILSANFRGQFSFSNSKGYFKGCNNNEALSVETNVALTHIYGKITSTPDTPVYIEFSGEITFSKSFEKQSEPVIRIDKIHHMASAKSSLQCAKPITNFVFKAQGDDPYWRINIDNEQLLFSSKASNQAYNVKISRITTTQINTIHATNEKEQNLTLTIQPAHCFSSNSNEYWGYSTIVSTLTEEYRGCGEPGWPIEEQPYSGDYLSTSNNITTDLILNANYTVEYKQTIAGKETLKSGFWKTHSAKKVVVMLTKEGNNNIRQELILQRQKRSLSTSEVNHNNIIKPIVGERLIFTKITANEGVETIKVNSENRTFVAQNINPDTDIDMSIQKALYHYFNLHRTDPKNTKFRAVKYDLNGDGFDDAIVLLDWCSDEHACEMLIFEGNKEGYQFTSRTARIHTPIIISKAQNYLWQSLLVKREMQWLLLKFDGVSYPINTHHLEKIKKDDYATGIVLFNEEKSIQWFPIKH
ncbi:MAG: hypothetical protein V5786_04525 [Psychromonas sp.]